MVHKRNYCQLLPDLNKSSGMYVNLKAWLAAYVERLKELVKDIMVIRYFEYGIDFIFASMNLGSKGGMGDGTRGNK